MIFNYLKLIRALSKFDKSIFLIKCKKISELNKLNIKCLTIFYIIEVEEVYLY